MEGIVSICSAFGLDKQYDVNRLNAENILCMYDCYVGSK